MEADPEPLTILPGRYRHNKTGKLYRVIGVALETETAEQLVIYQPLYETEYQLFARPYAMFVGDVEIDGQLVRRFEPLDN